MKKKNSDAIIERFRSITENPHEYDSDQVDVRKMDLPGAQRKTELFVHLMEAHRKRVHDK